MTYAAKTTVAPEASRVEIERTLFRYGASSFMYGWSGNQAIVGFVAGGRQVKFVIGMPDPADKRFTHYTRQGSPYEYERTESAARNEYEQAVRQRWRALALVIKAKLEAVEAGIATLEDEFLAYTVLPDGSTAGEFLRPQIDRAYESGEMPSLLPALGSGH